MENRLKKLREQIGKYGVLITNPINVYYFTEIKSSNITLYITDKKAYLVTDFRYEEIASRNKAGFIVSTDRKKILKEIITEKAVYFEAESMPYDTYLNYAKQFPNTNFISIKGIIKTLRMRKSDDEIACLEKVQEIADKSYLSVLSTIKEGMSELELKAELEYTMSKNGSEKPSFDSIILFGENSSLPHGEPSNRKLKNKDNILLDFGATKNGYISDMTRTIFFGKPSEEMKKAYDIVLEAHNLSVSRLNEGVLCSEIDRIAREHIENSGYKGLFGHSVGHGIGLDVHEGPLLSTYSKDILKNHMAFSIEPGVYMKNQFGIRIENTYYLLKSSAISLTNVEKCRTIL